MFMVIHVHIQHAVFKWIVINIKTLKIFRIWNFWASMFYIVCTFIINIDCMLLVFGCVKFKSFFLNVWSKKVCMITRKKSHSKYLKQKELSSFLSPPFAKAVDIKTYLSVCLSIWHKNFNLAHIFWSINGRALIFGIHYPCDKPFLLVPCSDFDLLQGQFCCWAGEHKSWNLLFILQKSPLKSVKKESPECKEFNRLLTEAMENQKCELYKNAVTSYHKALELADAKEWKVCLLM